MGIYISSNLFLLKVWWSNSSIVWGFGGLVGSWNLFLCPPFSNCSTLNNLFHILLFNFGMRPVNGSCDIIFLCFQPEKAKMEAEEISEDIRRLEDKHLQQVLLHCESL